MFYALLALAARENFTSSKHSGLIAWFDKQFVRSGLFPRELSRNLHLSFDRRQSNDYGEIWLVD